MNGSQGTCLCTVMLENSAINIGCLERKPMFVTEQINPKLVSGVIGCEDVISC